MYGNSSAGVGIGGPYFLVPFTHVQRMWFTSYINNMDSAPVDFCFTYFLPFLLWIASGRSTFSTKIKVKHCTTVACLIGKNNHSVKGGL